MLILCLRKAKNETRCFRSCFPGGSVKHQVVWVRLLTFLTAQWSCYGHSHGESSNTMSAGEMWWYGEKSVTALQQGSKIPSEEWGAGGLSTELLEVFITEKNKAWITCSVNAHRSCNTNLCSILPVINESISTISILTQPVDSRDFHAKALFSINHFVCHTYALTAKTITLRFSKFSLFLRITESWTS